MKENDLKVSQYVAQNLGLAKVPNYFDDDIAIREAEALIEEKGLMSVYVKSLHEMGAQPLRGASGAEAFRSQKCGYKVFAMQMMFRMIDDGAWQPETNRPSSSL